MMANLHQALDNFNQVSCVSFGLVAFPFVIHIINCEPYTAKICLSA